MQNVEEKKNKGGRPTKYHETYIQEVDQFIKERIEQKTIPTIEGFAFRIGVDVETVDRWRDKHKRFSGAIKRLKIIQSDILQLGIYNNTGNVAGGIFLLKNNHGFKDKHETDLTSGGKALPTPIISLTNDVLRDDKHEENKESI
jgi:DNA-binding transcriptional regulator YiaG